MDTSAAIPGTPATEGTPPPPATRSRWGAPQTLLLITGLALGTLASLDYFGVLGGRGGFSVLNITAMSIGLALLIGLAIYRCKKEKTPVKAEPESSAADSAVIARHLQTIDDQNREIQQLQREKAELHRQLLARANILSRPPIPMPPPAPGPGPGPGSAGIINLLT